MYSRDNDINLSFNPVTINVFRVKDKGKEKENMTCDHYILQRGLCI